MTLILIPTRLEAGHLIGQDLAETLMPGLPIATQLHGEHSHVALCAFGLAAAGVNASHALWNLASADQTPERVFLVGTAGVYDATRFPVATCVAAGAVHCAGLGIPTADGRYTLNLPQAGPVSSESCDRLTLQLPAAKLPSGCFLSVATASDADAAAHRQAIYPECVAEEMEGYAVALACSLWNLPLTMIRGISNVAGDRDQQNWRIAQAMAAVNNALRDAVSG